MRQRKPEQQQFRQDWEKQIREALILYGVEKDKDDEEWLEAQLTNDNEWEWHEEL